MFIRVVCVIASGPWDPEEVPATDQPAQVTEATRRTHVDRRSDSARPRPAELHPEPMRASVDGAQQSRRPLRIKAHEEHVQIESIRALRPYPMRPPEEDACNVS